MPDLLPLSLRWCPPGRIRPQLEELQRVLAELGNPQLAFPSILIVGTNGKGSTAAMLEAILRAHGLATGLYTSPHLVRVEERIRILGSAVDGGLLERCLGRLEPYSDLTFFEAVTAAAFLCFAEAGVECAVLEAGMGGRWDATRAAASTIAGLTNVGSDHQQWLGEHWEERAADKGSALAAARFGVIGPEFDDNHRGSLGAPSALPASDLVTLEASGGRTAWATWEDRRVELVTPLEGRHQVHNLQLALALARAAEEAGFIDRLDPRSVTDGLREVRWTGRLTRHSVRGRWVLMDCAHNLEAAQVLAAHLARIPGLYHLLFSCLEDKPVEAMAALLRPSVGNVVVCQLHDDRAMPLDRLRRAFPEAEVAASAAEALERLPAPIIAAGSVRLVGELLADDVERAG